MHPVVPSDMTKLAANYGFNPGLIVGDLLFISGQVGRSPGVPDPETLEDEYRLAWRNIGAVLAEAGATFADLVQVNSFHTDLAHLPTFMQVRAEFLADSPVAPTWTALGINQIGAPGATVEISAIARLPQAD